MSDRLSKKKLLFAIKGAKNMAAIFQAHAVDKCLTQLEEKINEGEFDYEPPAHLSVVGGTK